MQLTVSSHIQSMWYHVGLEPSNLLLQARVFLSTEPSEVLVFSISPTQRRVTSCVYGKGMGWERSMLSHVATSLPGYNIKSVWQRRKANDALLLAAVILSSLQ